MPTKKDETPFHGTPTSFLKFCRANSVFTMVGRRLEHFHLEWRFVFFVSREFCPSLVTIIVLCYGIIYNTYNTMLQLCRCLYKLHGIIILMLYDEPRCVSSSFPQMSNVIVQSQRNDWCVPRTREKEIHTHALFVKFWNALLNFTYQLSGNRIRID